MKRLTHDISRVAVSLFGLGLECVNTKKAAIKKRLLNFLGDNFVTKEEFSVFSDMVKKMHTEKSEKKSDE